MADPRCALLLTAGLGTRLHPLTLVRAKPAIPVAGVPLVRRILRWLAGQGVEEAVLNLHHLPHTITAVVGDGSDVGLRVRYSWEHPSVLGSAGGPRLALPLIGSDSFLIVNGDTLTNVDLAGLYRHHAESNALVTLALTPNREPARYGGLRLDGAGRVTDVVPRGPDAADALHFVGVQVASAAAFQSLTPGTFANSIGDLYTRLVTERPGSVAGFSCDASFQDIGTVEDYLVTSRRFETHAVEPTSATFAPTARVHNSILWDDVEIGDRAVIEDCIVTDHVRVGAGEVHRRRILVAGAHELLTFPLPADPAVS